MPPNIYDDDKFFAEYCRLPRSVEGLDGAPEWPALRALLPGLGGASVLDLGCGFGWFCRWARQRGAARVLGLDISWRMLERARAAGGDAAITYVRADMESLDLPKREFHLVYSSLALHYVLDLENLLQQVRSSLISGGRLVFSVEHPIFTAPQHPEWVRNAAGRSTWPIDNYLEEGPRLTDWLVKDVVKQHRTLATYLNLLIRTGFTIAHIEEWGPSRDQIAARSDLADERHRPPFLMIAADES